MVAGSDRDAGFPFFELPNWAVRLVVLTITTGFPVALVLAWAFELTPEGIKRTEEADLVTRSRSRAWIYVAIVAGMLSLGLFFLGRYTAPTRSAGSEVRDKSIAVLPFVDLSQSKDQEYFCDGISEEILDSLAKVEGLRVIARTSSFAFKGKQDEIITKLAQVEQLKVISRTSTARYQSRPENLRTVGRELGVATVLEGSVQKSGDDVRINVQLIDAQTDQHLWAQSYTRTLKNIFEVEAELAEKVAEALQVKLAPAEVKRLATAATTNPRAHELYLRARSAGAHSDEASVQQQIALVRAALAEDPHYSGAWAELVNAYYSLADAYRAPLEILPEMQRAALKAIETDESSGVGHQCLGSIALVYARDFPLAKRELQRAVALDPNSSDTHRWYGWYLARVERDFPRARAEFSRSRILDPRYPWPLWGESAVAIAQGDYPAASRSAEQLMELEPHWFYDTDPIAHVLIAMQRWREALQRYESLPASVLSKPNFEMAICYAHLGEQARARGILAELENLARERYVDKIHLAAIHAALGEKDHAFAALEQAAQDRSARISAPRFYSAWLSPLFDDPRFAAFEDKIAHSAMVPPAESSTP